MTATSFADFGTTEAPGTHEGPHIYTTHWGYALRHDTQHQNAGRIAAMGGRFFGAILLMAAAGLWIMPDALMTADVFAMKLAAMVMFAVFGSWLVWAGRRATGFEYEVDTSRSELRVGARDFRGEFQLKGVLAFAEIASVYLLRSKDHSQPTRLYLRVGRGDEALEIASGAEARLEALRDRLARDFAREPAPKSHRVGARLADHTAIAA
jgi:hypothetical protein